MRARLLVLLRRLPRADARRQDGAPPAQFRAIAAAQFSDALRSRAQARPQWDDLSFGAEAAALLQRTGHTLTALRRGARLILLGGRNLQREGGGGGGHGGAGGGGGGGFSNAPSYPTGFGGGGGGPTVLGDGWVLELPPRQPPVLRELIADGAAPPPRALHTATILGDVLYVIGGVGPHDRPLHDVHALDTLQWRWSQPPISGRPPALLSRHSATALNGALYVFGGCAPGRAASATTDRRSAASGKLKYSSQLHTLGPARDAVSGAPVLTSSSGCPPLVWHAVEVAGKPPAPHPGRATAVA